MSIGCTRCEGTGFLNLCQVPEKTLEASDSSKCPSDVILAWMRANEDHDVMVCDCCGDGESWYSIPGEHYNDEDPEGPDGPYASNGGLCHCH